MTHLINYDALFIQVINTTSLFQLYTVCCYLCTTYMHIINLHSNATDLYIINSEVDALLHQDDNYSLCNVTPIIIDKCRTSLKRTRQITTRDLIPIV